MADTIKIGSLNIDKIYLGINGDVEVYLGTVKVYPEDVPPTPFNGKYKFTLTDDSVVSGECDSSSAITKAETSAYQTTLKEAVVGDCVTSIGQDTFNQCSGLTSIDISDSVTSIGKFAFNQCSGLTSIDISDSVTSIGKFAFYFCSGLTSVNIPSGVTSVGQATFYYCSSLTNIVIPNGVTEIGNQAFYSCNHLTSVTIGSGVANIGSQAFAYCSGLTSVTVNATTPPSIGSSVFYDTNNCPIYVPCESVEAYKTAWSAYADRITCVQPSFNGKYKFTLTDDSVVSGECDSSSELARSVTSAYTATMKEAVVGDCVTSIGHQAFNSCTGLTKVVLPDSVTSIGQIAFQYCISLTSIEIPSGVTTIDWATFNDCSGLTSVNIPSSVTTIGDNAFNDCTSLTSIDIPESVTSFGEYAFANCSSLTSITVNAVTPPSLSPYDVFLNTNNCPIYVPSASVNAYKAASRWSKYASRIQAIP